MSITLYLSLSVVRNVRKMNWLWTLYEYLIFTLQTLYLSRFKKHSLRFVVRISVEAGASDVHTKHSGSRGASVAPSSLRRRRRSSWHVERFAQENLWSWELNFVIFVSFTTIHHGEYLNNFFVICCYNWHDRLLTG